MMKRLVIFSLIIILAACLGLWLGVMISYWFVPSFMRLYLSWGEYLAQLHDNLLPGDPFHIWQIVATCRLSGALVMIILAAYGYNKYRNRNTKCQH